MRYGGPSRLTTTLLLIVFVHVTLGLLLLLAFGDHFFFWHEAQFQRWLRAAVPFVALALMIAGLCADKPSKEMRKRVPNVFLRWAAWPLFSYLTAGVLLLSPLGWIAGASKALASAPTEMTAIVHEMRPYSRPVRGGCGQRAEIEIRNVRANTCVADLRVDPSLTSGSHAIAVGQVSRYGVHLQELRAR